MKKMLLEICKEMATDARIKGTYDLFLQGRFHKVMSKFNLQAIGE